MASGFASVKVATVVVTAAPSVALIPVPARWTLSAASFTVAASLAFAVEAAVIKDRGLSRVRALVAARVVAMPVTLKVPPLRVTVAAVELAAVTPVDRGAGEVGRGSWRDWHP